MRNLVMKHSSSSMTGFPADHETPWSQGVEFITRQDTRFSRTGNSFFFRDENHNAITRYKKAEPGISARISYSLPVSSVIYSDTRANDMKRLASIYIENQGSKKTASVTNAQGQALLTLKKISEYMVEVTTNDNRVATWQLNAQKRPYKLKLNDEITITVRRDCAKLFEKTAEGIELGVPRTKQMVIPAGCDVFLALVTFDAVSLLYEKPAAPTIMRNFNKFIATSYSSFALSTLSPPGKKMSLDNSGKANSPRSADSDTTTDRTTDTEVYENGKSTDQIHVKKGGGDLPRRVNSKLFKSLDSIASVTSTHFSTPQAAHTQVAETAPTFGYDAYDAIEETTTPIDATEDVNSVATRRNKERKAEVMRERNRSQSSQRNRSQKHGSTPKGNSGVGQFEATTGRTSRGSRRVKGAGDGEEPRDCGSTRRGDEGRRDENTRPGETTRRKGERKKTKRTSKAEGDGESVLNDNGDAIESHRNSSPYRRRKNNDEPTIPKA